MLRPDIAITSATSVIVLELTVCHETNVTKSRDYKLNKYLNLNKALKIPWHKSQLRTLTVEVSTLGCVSDLSQFSKAVQIEKISKETLKRIAVLALNHSFSIYINRNHANCCL